MEKAQQKTNHGPGSKKSLSWGEGVKLTHHVFNEISDPYTNANAQTMEDATEAFREKNQAFLNGSAAGVGGGGQAPPVADAARGSKFLAGHNLGGSPRNPMARYVKNVFQNFILRHVDVEFVLR